MKSPEIPDFVPSRAQRRLYDCILAQPDLIRIGELCRRAGVPRRTYYFWTLDPRFCAWLTTAWSSRLLTGGIPRLNTARARAPHSIRSWKAMSALTFEPRGLASLLTADNASTVRNQTKTVSPPPQPNQSLTAADCTNSRKKIRHPIPLQTLKLLDRSLRPRAPAKKKPPAQPPGNTGQP